MSFDSPVVVAIKFNNGKVVGLSAGDRIRVLPFGVYKGNGLVLSATTSAERVKQFLLHAPLRAGIEIVGIGFFTRSDVNQVFEYEG